MALKSFDPRTTKRGRKPVAKGETPHETFVRIGRPRLRNAIKSIRLVGNLAAYGPTSAEVVFINEGLLSAVEHAMARFSKEAPPNLEQQFDLSRVVDQEHPYERAEKSVV